MRHILNELFCNFFWKELDTEFKLKGSVFPNVLRDDLAMMDINACHQVGKDARSITFLFILSQAVRSLLSVYCKPKYQTSRNPMVFTTFEEGASGFTHAMIGS